MSRHSYWRKSAPRPSVNKFKLLLPSQAWLARARRDGVDTTSLSAFNAWKAGRR